MANNIERRNNTWFATLHIPKDVQINFGKSKFFKTLNTTDKRVACNRAKLLVGEWKLQIEQARGSLSNTALEALEFNRHRTLARSFEEEYVVKAVASDRAEDIEKKHGYDKAIEFINIATGKSSLLQPHLKPWTDSLINSVSPQTLEKYSANVKRMIDKFTFAEAITKKEVLLWKSELEMTSKSGTIQKMFTSCSSFWRYLQNKDIVDIEKDSPFVGVSFKSDAKPYDPFKPEEIVQLVRQTSLLERNVMKDFILLAAYTGARRNEIAQLRTTDITLNKSLLITEAKTKAGVREVPIHSAISDLVSRLKDSSRDGYLIHCDANRRGDTLGKRFATIATRSGIVSGKRKLAFHSIRKTFVTMLENAGINENVTADIVGHEKPRITYGLYSGGASLEVKRKAIENIEYDF